MTERLALELATIRVNMITAGFVDWPLSAATLGDRLEARRAELRSILPIRRVVVRPTRGARRSPDDEHGSH